MENKQKSLQNEKIKSSRRKTVKNLQKSIRSLENKIQISLHNLHKISKNGVVNMIGTACSAFFLPF